MSNSRSNSRSNSMELEFMIAWEDESPRKRTKSRTISIESIESNESIESILMNDNISVNTTYTSLPNKNVIDIKNGHKIRKKNVDIGVLYYDPSPRPSLFLEKIKDNEEWSQSRLKLKK